MTNRVATIRILPPRAGNARAPHGSRRIWKTLKIQARQARAMPVRGTRGILRIIQPNHKYTVVSSRTGPVAWCDHENSTDVKFLPALHSALRARNRTGDKNRTGPVVGCDWGIKVYLTKNSYSTDQNWGRY